MNEDTFMNYIETDLAIDERGRVFKKKPVSGAGKYHGAIAGGYDAKRETSEKWIKEQEIVERMLGDLPSGDWVLDVPCGTGRFFEFYHKMGFIIRGIDKSEDMLKLAAAKAVDSNQVRLQEGDVRALPLQDKSVDASVMVRLTRWLSPEDCQHALRELQRVTRDRIILTTRISHPTNADLARPVDLYIDALEKEWYLAENAEGYEPSYRILMFKRNC